MHMNSCALSAHARRVPKLSPGRLVSSELMVHLSLGEIHTLMAPGHTVRGYAHQTDYRKRASKPFSKACAPLQMRAQPALSRDGPHPGAGMPAGVTHLVHRCHLPHRSQGSPVSDRTGPPFAANWLSPALTHLAGPDVSMWRSLC